MDGPGRVVILGCGWLGTRIGDLLRRGGAEVHATTTTESKLEVLRFLGFTPHRVDLASGVGLEEALEGAEAAVLCAAPGRRGGYEEVYGRGVERLARALAAGGPRRLVYTGSTGVYPQDDGSWVDEDSPTPASDERSRVLLEAEDRLLSAEGVSTTALRLAGLWGPGRDPAAWAARSAGASRDDGEAWLNLIHGEDAARAVADLLAREHRGVLCLSDGHPHRRREVYDALLARQGLEGIRWSDGGHRGRRVANGRLLSLLGLELRHPRYEPGPS